MRMLCNGLLSLLLPFEKEVIFIEKRKADMSCARVKQYKSSNIGSAERHNERKNDSYENLNVVPERIQMNVHFVDPGKESYMDILRRMEEAGKVSLRGLRQDATLFDEIIIDVNTVYFERNGGYEYAVDFYKTAVDFLKEKFGSDYVISATMHADEINKAVTAEIGRDTFHYHLHAIVLPVVEKEILWSKRCKDPDLVGKVKTTVNQISHSKKWSFNVPQMDDDGNPVLRKNGKPKFRPSYSVLQDEFFDYMQEHGYKDFIRGERGSTAEHLSSLQYQIAKDSERLLQIEQDIRDAEIQYKSASTVHKTYSEIDDAGRKNLLTGNYSVSKEDFKQLTALAKEGISSRAEIERLRHDVSSYRNRSHHIIKSLEQLQEKYDNLLERCRPFLYSLEHLPELTNEFTDAVREKIKEKEVSEKAKYYQIKSGKKIIRKEKQTIIKNRDKER